MKNRKRIGEICAVALLLLLAFTGCAGFWNPPTSTTTTTTTTLSSGYFYVLDQTDAKILSYYISSGTLKLASSTTLPATPISFALAPNNGYMFVSTYSGIFGYSISSGTLTLVSSTAISSDEATAMAVDKNSQWLLEGYGDSGTITMNAIPISGGAMNSSASTCMNSSVVCTVTYSGSNSSATLNQLAFSSNDGYLFASFGSYGTAVYLFTHSNTNPFGNGKVYSPINSSGSALSVAADPAGRLVYVGESDAVSSSGGLRAFKYSTSSSTPVLTEISGSPYSSGGTGPYAILPESSGSTVYVANWNGTNSGVMDGFTVSASSSTYTLAKLSATVSTGIKPVSIAEDADDNFVLVENAGGSPYLSAYVFDTTTSTTLDLALYDSTYVGIAMAALQ